MTARPPKPRTDAERSRARYQRAAATLPPITLDADHAAALSRLLARTGETQAALVRRLIREAERVPYKSIVSERPKGNVDHDVGHDGATVLT